MQRLNSFSVALDTHQPSIVYANESLNLERIAIEEAPRAYKDITAVIDSARSSDRFSCGVAKASVNHQRIRISSMSDTTTRSASYANLFTHIRDQLKPHGIKEVFIATVYDVEDSRHVQCQDINYRLEKGTPNFDYQQNYTLNDLQGLLYPQLSQDIVRLGLDVVEKLDIDNSNYDDGYTVDVILDLEVNTVMTELQYKIITYSEPQKRMINLKESEG